MIRTSSRQFRRMLSVALAAVALSACTENQPVSPDADMDMSAQLAPQP
jgi:outer membrane PBP1 activator LpoA protein